MSGTDRMSVVLDTLAGRPAAALLRGAELHDLVIDPPEQLPRVGAIFRASVDRPMKGLGGAMVRLPGMSGFLRKSHGLPEGRPLLVQVTGQAEPGKAVPVTARLLFKGRWAIVTPGAPGLNIARGIRDDAERLRLHGIAAAADLPEACGLIVRSAAVAAADDAIAGEIAALAGAAAAVLGDAGQGPELLLDGPDPAEFAWQEWAGAEVDPGAGGFVASGVLDALDALAAPEPLPGGGRLHVEPTRALVAVDVDTGGDGAGAAGLKANIAALRALPRQLRLRGLGGQIVVDPAPMPKKDRRQLEQALKAAFRDDPVETAFVGWTPLGHLELQRKRERCPLPLAALSGEAGP